MPTTGTAARPRLRRGAHLQASLESRSPRGSGTSVLNAFGERRVLQRDSAHGHGQRGSPRHRRPRAHQEEALLAGVRRTRQLEVLPGVPDPSAVPRTSSRNAPRGGVPARLTRITHASGSQFPGSCFKAMGSGLGLADRPGEDKPDSWASGHRPQGLCPSRLGTANPRPGAGMETIRVAHPHSSLVPAAGLRVSGPFQPLPPGRNQTTSPSALPAKRPFHVTDFLKRLQSQPWRLWVSHHSSPRGTCSRLGPGHVPQGGPMGERPDLSGWTQDSRPSQKGCMRSAGGQPLACSLPSHGVSWRGAGRALSRVEPDSGSRLLCEGTSLSWWGRFRTWLAPGLAGVQRSVAGCLQARRRASPLPLPPSVPGSHLLQDHPSALMGEALFRHLPEKSDTPAPNPAGGPPLDFPLPSAPKSPLPSTCFPTCIQTPEPSSESCPPSSHRPVGHTGLTGTNPGPDQKKHTTPTRMTPGPWGHLDT